MKNTCFGSILRLISNNSDVEILLDQPREFFVVHFNLAFVESFPLGPIIMIRKESWTENRRNLTFTCVDSVNLANFSFQALSLKGLPIHNF